MLGILVYLGVFGLLAVGTIRRSAFGLSAALCMFVIEQWGQTKVNFVASHASLTNYLGCIIVLLGIAGQVLRGKRFRLIHGPVRNSFVLVLSLLLALDTGARRRHCRMAPQFTIHAHDVRFGPHAYSKH